jgi:uroporphyrinogen-III synthase
MDKVDKTDKAKRAMRVLITRPREDALSLARELAEIGVDALIEPLLTIDYHDSPPRLAGVQALLMTSANGVRAFVRLSNERTLPLFAVGDATAGTAAEADFENVFSAAGDVAALAELVAAKCDPNAGELLHVAGSRVAGDLGGALAAAGFKYRRAVLYAARKAESLTTEARDALRAGGLAGIVLYSPRTARTFAELVRAAGLEETLADTYAFCLSPAVADALSGLAWRKLAVARRSEQTAMIGLIGLIGLIGKELGL